MEPFFKFDLENLDIKIFKNSDRKKQDNRIIKTGKPFSDNSIQCRPYRELGIISKIFIKRKDKYILKSLDMINNNPREALNILHKIQKGDKKFSDVSYILSLLETNYENKISLINNVFDNINNFNYIFNKYKISLEVSLNLENNYILTLNNNKEDLLIFLGLIYYNKGFSKKALLILKSLKKNNNPLISLLLGDIYLKIGEYNKAIILLQNLKFDGILCFYSLLILGKAFREEGLLKTSIAVLRKTRRFSSEISTYLKLEGRYQLALSLEEFNKQFLAIREYEKILSIKYDYRDTFFRLKKIKNS